MTQLNLAMPLSARLGWRLDQAHLIAGDEGGDDEQTVRFLPVMPWLVPLDSEIVLDLLALLRSAQTPGGHYVLNCSCGIADDAEIGQLAFVSHPAADLIVWQLEWNAYGKHISPQVPRRGKYLELHFVRSHYEADLRAMWNEVAGAHATLPLHELQPGDCGAFETLQMELGHGQAETLRLPVLPVGSHLKFGLTRDQSDCFSLNAKSNYGWPIWFMTNHPTNEAFESWLDFANRGWTFKPQLEPSYAFFLRDETKRDACDTAGRHLVNLLREAWASSVPPQEIEVTYLPCDIPAAQTPVAGSS